MIHKMDELLTIIAKIGLELHPDRIESIAEKIDIISSAEKFSQDSVNFGPNADREMIRQFELAWKNSRDISSKEVSYALREASAAAQLSEMRGVTELTWTGPTTGLVPMRHTEQALCEVIDSAKLRLFLVSFVAYRVDSVISALKNAIRRQVTIGMLLEPSDKHGGGITSHDSVKTIRENLPSIDIYEWRKNIGAVHAKCAVADERIAFITSANLTSAAMERNMELGVIIKGGELPLALHRHLEALIHSCIIVGIDH
jgi:phosphatidylserine/phosphatidylglycerophosphate/cardiolipin synthase-like enzyme